MGSGAPVDIEQPSGHKEKQTEQSEDKADALLRKGKEKTEKRQETKGADNQQTDKDNTEKSQEKKGADNKDIGKDETEKTQEKQGEQEENTENKQGDKAAPTEEVQDDVEEENAEERTENAVLSGDSKDKVCAFALPGTKAAVGGVENGEPLEKKPRLAEPKACVDFQASLLQKAISECSVLPMETGQLEPLHAINEKVEGAKGCARKSDLEKIHEYYRGCRVLIGQLGASFNKAISEMKLVIETAALSMS